MPIHPDSPLTQAEQDAVNVLLSEWGSANTAINAAESALNAHLVTAYGAAPNDEAADLFGDGDLKPADECALPAGRVPLELRNRRHSAKGTRGKKGSRPGPPAKISAHDRRPPQARRAQSAAVTAEQMGEADTLHLARQARRDEYNDAGQQLSLTIADLMYRGGVQLGTALDVFNDGLPKPVDSIDWPAGVEQYRSIARQ